MPPTFRPAERVFHGWLRPQDMEAILTLLIPVTFLVMLALERAFPARPLPVVKGWLLKGFAFFFLTAVINALVPAALAALVGDRAPLRLAWLGTALGGLVGFLASDLVAYGVHRLLHNVPFLWRWTHQMHHSAERLDIAGGVYFHPLDIAAQVGATSLAVLLLGLSADAAALAGFVSFLAAMFQHLNVRTPRWIGFLVQRPEAHSVHHARGVHAYNYGNFMLWDLVFGTFRNPATFEREAGFWDGASREVGPMLLGRDVSEPRAASTPPAPAHAEPSAS